MITLTLEASRLQMDTFSLRQLYQIDHSIYIKWIHASVWHLSHALDTWITIVDFPEFFFAFSLLHRSIYLTPSGGDAVWGQRGWGWELQPPKFDAFHWKSIDFQWKTIHVHSFSLTWVSVSFRERPWASASFRELLWASVRMLTDAHGRQIIENAMILITTMKFHGSTGRRGTSQMLTNAHGRSRTVREAHGSSWTLTDTHRSSRMLMDAHVDEN